MSYLPEKPYLYTDEVDRLVAEIEKNPSVYVPYIKRLKEYDAQPFYKKKIEGAITHIEPGKVFLPENQYLYTEQVDRLVAEIEKNPSVYVPYIKRLKEYDAQPFYKKKIEGAIIIAERSGQASAERQPAVEPFDWFKDLKPPDSPKESMNWLKDLKPPDSPKESMDWFKDVTPEELSVPSSGKKLKNTLKFLLPYFKSEEDKIDTLLLEKKSVTDPRVANKLIQQNPYNIMFIHPSIYTEDMILKVAHEGPLFLIFVDIDHPLIKRMLPELLAIPNICEYMKIENYFTEDILYQLDFRSVFDVASISVGPIVYIQALCHGGLVGPITVTQPVTRYSSVPLGVCEIASCFKFAFIRRTTTYKNFVENNVTNMMELINRSYPEQDKRYVAVKKLTTVPKKIVRPGNEMMNKIFSCVDKTNFMINFLDIVTETGKYNLFSIKPEWSLEEVLSLFPGKEIVLCDYSCSLNESFPKEDMERLGGTKRKRRRKRTRKN